MYATATVLDGWTVGSKKRKNDFKNISWREKP